MKDEQILKKLIKLSQKASRIKEPPIAALIVENNKIISKAYNKRNKNQKTIDHAEIIAITKANKKLKNWRLNNCTLYVTIEPCEMCKNVIKESRIKKVYYILPRLEFKKIYDKTEFNKINNNKYIDDLIKEYTQMNENFWSNMR